MENCEFVMLGDIVNIKTGKLDANASSPDGKYPFFTCAKEPLRINSYSYDCECVLVAGNGDLNVKYFHGKFDAYQRTYIIERKNDNLYMPYLYYFLDNYIEILRKKSIGGIIKYIKLNNLTDIKFPLPEKQKQIEISNILSKSKATINNLKTRIQKYDELVKSQFIEMFGDPVSNTKGWSVTQLSEHIKFLTSGSRGWAKYFSEYGEYFITIKNVKNCKITLDDVQYITPPQNAEAKRTKVQEGDLLISITADLGRTGVVTKEIAEYGGYINQHLSCIRVDNNELNSLYLAHYLESDAGKIQFQAKNQSVVKAGLNFASINSLRILTPPIELQNQFADFVKHIDKLKFRKNITKLRNICYNIFNFEKFNMQREVKNG